MEHANERWIEENMKNDLNVRTVGIVGCGLIGMSWAAYYLAKGFAVRATDPMAGAEEKLRAYIDSAWTLLEKMGLEPGADKNNLTFSTDLKVSLKGVDFVQENGPERLDLKLKLFKDISDAIGPDVIIASSSSGIPVSNFQTERPIRRVSCLVILSTRRTSSRWSRLSGAS